MHPRLLSLLLLLLLAFGLNTARAQQKIYFQADLLEYDEDIRPGVEQYTGNVIFRHGETVGYCQSADNYRSENRMHAYGNPVRIHVNDSVTLYGKEIMYDGNSRVVTIYYNVRLTDNSTTLYTDSMTYDLDAKMGYYLCGGRMVSDSNVLTSQKGYYYTDSKTAYVSDSVLFVNETYTGTCDNAAYNTATEVLHFTSRTHLYSTENEAWTDKGWYDTKEELVSLVGNAELHNQNQHISGDSLYFDNNIKYGQGWNHVHLVDSVQNFIVDGNYLEYLDCQYAISTDSCMLTLIDEGNDSLFLHADTLRVLFDTAQNPTDMFAYNHAKFFRHDMQGACDSLVYHLNDSIILMFYTPVVWSAENQLTADTIKFLILDSANIDVHLCRTAFIASSLFNETEFNQIRGITITGRIHERELVRVDVVGNAECLYYIQEQDSSLIGVNSTMTSEMTIFFKDSEIQTIRFYNDPDGKLHPDQELSDDDRRLKDFKWMSAFRPTDISGIFDNPVIRPEETSKTTAEP
jgi:lipopolysaccharide export system protein LptA